MQSSPVPTPSPAVESHFIMSIHENFAAQEVADIAEAFAKVEQAYLR